MQLASPMKGGPRSTIEFSYTILILLSAAMALWSLRVPKHLVAAVYFGLLGVFVKFLLWGAPPSSGDVDALAYVNITLNFIVVALALGLAVTSAHVLLQVKKWQKVVQILSYCMLGVIVVLLVTSTIADAQKYSDPSFTMPVVDLVFQQLSLLGTVIVPVLNLYMIKKQPC